MKLCSVLVDLPAVYFNNVAICQVDIFCSWPRDYLKIDWKSKLRNTSNPVYKYPDVLYGTLLQITITSFTNQSMHS